MIGLRNFGNMDGSARGREVDSRKSTRQLGRAGARATPWRPVCGATKGPLAERISYIVDRAAHFGSAPREMFVTSRGYCSVKPLFQRHSSELRITNISDKLS